MKRIKSIRCRISRICKASVALCTSAPVLLATSAMAAVPTGWDFDAVGTEAGLWIAASVGGILLVIGMGVGMNASMGAISKANRKFFG